VSPPLIATLPPKLGLKADSLRVPFVVPSTARKSSEAVDEAVVESELMRMSAILGDGYELIAAAVDKPIPR
jgi:hypothetical protein